MFFLILFTILFQSFACPSRQDAISCFYNKCDLNHDNKIDKLELSKAIDTYLPWYQRIPFHMFGGIDQVLKDCDANKDNILTAEEAITLHSTCLNTCYKRKMTLSTFNCK